ICTGNSPKADHELRLKPDHPMGSGQPAFFGLVFGLKNGGCQWTSVAFAGMKKGAEAPLFNDLQTSVEVCRS
ncbi:hypothetical protein, partial [Burkholderia multivorans]|uniref:hypothetical protein n=1 Tax=Burkholderia multivorans TaxID=87883 RepID=UPI001C613DD8